MNKDKDYYKGIITTYFGRVYDAEGRPLYQKGSHLNHILERIASDFDKQQLAAERTIEIVARGIQGELSLSGIAFNLGESIGYVSGYSPQQPPAVNEAGIAKMGISIIDWLAQENWIEPIKLYKRKNEQVWRLLPKGEFADFVLRFAKGSAQPSLLKPLNWQVPLIKVKGNPIELVKRSHSAGLLNNYTVENMPKVYEAVNRQNNQGWKINKHILNIIESSPENNPFLPKFVSDEEMQDAKDEMQYNRKVLEYYKRFVIREALKEADLHKNHKERIAEAKKQQKLKDDNEGVTKIMSNYDKWMQFERTKEIAESVKDETIYFAYNFDSRGRMYALQHDLNPLSNDFAKSLLLYADENVIDEQDLAITTANLMGKDKLLFEDRIKYVYANLDMIADIGANPWENIDELMSLGLSAKDKWQFLAIARVWHEYLEWIADGNPKEEFTTGLPSHRDASTQGLQILSLIGRDEFCAPMVNIAPTTNGKMGDAYAFIGSFLADKLDTLEERSDELNRFINAIRKDPKKARTVCKRNVMTRAYAATRYGAGQQQIEDKKTYEFSEADALSRKDCYTLGSTIYDLTVDKFKKSSELMDFMVDGIIYNPKAVMTWRLPDGFLAFQHKEKRNKVMASGMIGGQKVNLTVLIPNNKPETRKHQSAISPNIVHSLDGYLLREILRRMPKSAPISTVHDSFATSTWHSQMLVDIVRAVMIEIGDRKTFKEMLDDCFGKQRELPKAGTFDIMDLHNTDYFIS